MAYSKEILEILRQRIGVGQDDSSEDCLFDEYTKNQVFHEVCNWNGLLGYYDLEISRWIKEIYGIDLQKQGEKK